MAVNFHLSTDEARDMDALVYLRNVDRWQKQIHLKSGRRVYGLPSRSRAGLFHLTDGTDCSCEDRNRNGATCAHMRAARLYRMERQGQIVADAKMAERGLQEAGITLADLRDLFPPCAAGCGQVTEGNLFCDDCGAKRERSERLAAARRRVVEAWV